MKVLLIEDHPELAQISCRLLAEVHGHEVEHAANGREALARAATFRPDLLLVDLNLPDMSGYDVVAQLRDKPEFAATVMIALTGFGNVVDDRRAAEAGIDAHFRKPMDFDLLDRIKSPVR